MSAVEHQILTLFSGLNRSEQWRMVAAIMQTMQESEKQLGITFQQQKEIDRIITDYDNGKMETFTWKEVKSLLNNGKWRTL